MKTIMIAALSFCLSGVATVVISNQTAQACLRIISAKDSRGDMVCQKTSEDAEWCYYNCTCTGDCDRLYDQFGLIDA